MYKINYNIHIILIIMLHIYFMFKPKVEMNVRGLRGKLIFGVLTTYEDKRNK